MRPYRDSTQRWIEFKNDSGSSIGPYAAMRVSGYQQDADTAHQVVLKVAAPNDEAGQSICFNGNKTVAVGKTGYCTFDAPCYAAVSTGGSNGDLYGVEDGNLELVPDDAGAFTYLATVAAGPNGEIVALIDKISGATIKLGKTDAAHAKGASGTISVYSGTKGSETDSGENVTAWNRYANVASGKWVTCVWINGGWDLVAGEC